eukprot:1170317-Alexandrium_andersonii.AAC.1
MLGPEATSLSAPGTREPSQSEAQLRASLGGASWDRPGVNRRHPLQAFLCRRTRWSRVLPEARWQVV